MAPRSTFRPHGPLRWLIPKLDLSSPWSVIGAISAEDRWIAAADECQRLLPQANVRLLQIEPAQITTSVWLDENNRRLASNASRAEARFGKASLAFKSAMTALDHDVIDLAERIVESSGSHVVLDVSTMPKRFFFTLLTLLSESTRITTLVVTNTTPQDYGKELAHDADEWRPLPIYCGDSRDESPKTTLMIGVGYHPFRIQELLERSTGRQFGIKLFLPFPSLHPGGVENWKFVRGIVSEWERGDARIPIVRVPTHDVSLAFDALRNHSIEGRTPALTLAPFGPKALSLAMCLLGIARAQNGYKTEIGYTQPQVYAPDYSIGTATQDAIPKVAAYCVKVNGRNLYSITE